jgi:D-arabinose 1-dehydrogenase-like Zn-dependent alcohol dehydrogenase
VTGITSDGGYGDYMIARAEAVALVPEELSPVEAAPFMCAGVTTFNALWNSGAHAGDLVAVLGLGGLGHLGVQFAARLGFRTVAIARGRRGARGRGSSARGATSTARRRTESGRPGSNRRRPAWEAECGGSACRTAPTQI